MSKTGRWHPKNQRAMTLWGKILNLSAHYNKLLAKKKIFSGHPGTLGSQNRVHRYPNGTWEWFHGPMEPKIFWALISHKIVRLFRFIHFS